MYRQTVLFAGQDASIFSLGLWETNGAVGSTSELTGISGAHTGEYGLYPEDLISFNRGVLFEGLDAGGDFGLWVSNGTAAGTYELTDISGADGSGIFHAFGFAGFAVFDGEVLFTGYGAGGDPGLWVTNGAVAGTTEVVAGIDGFDFTAFNNAFQQSEVLFEDDEDDGLWLTNGTASGTFEEGGIQGAASSGLFSGPSIYADFTVLDGQVLFEGRDVSGYLGLWVTDGTGAQELTGISSAYSGGIFDIAMNEVFKPGFAVYNDEVLFAGVDANRVLGLWASNGTSAGTSELAAIGGAYVSGLFANFNLQPEFAVLNGEVLFGGADLSGNLGLWVSNGTAGGTSELTGISGANPSGLFYNLYDPSFTVFNGEVLFAGNDASGQRGLWMTNGASAGTYEVTGIIGTPSTGLFPSDLIPAPVMLVPAADNFNSNDTSDILFRNTSTGDTWFEAARNGKIVGGWTPIGGSDTSYAVAGVGDFLGTGTSDILFRNDSSGDTWFEAMSSGAFAGWYQVGGSDTYYSVVGVGDFFGTGWGDILFLNTSTGDTWFETTRDQKAAGGWFQIGGSDTHYSVVGVGDFYGGGTDDILFRNNSTGDTWFEQMTNGAFAGWHQIGGSDTHYSVVGVGDFFGDGIDDILFRNNSTGDTWIEAISNGAFAGWHQIGGSDTTYSVVAIGDYFGSNTSDILFRNNSTGDTWFEQITNGAFAGWNQIGGSSTSYGVPITVGPPALT
jgi:ELWxxDGT repeat protein